MDLQMKPGDILIVKSNIQIIIRIMIWKAFLFWIQNDSKMIQNQNDKKSSCGHGERSISLKVNRRTIKLIYLSRVKIYMMLLVITSLFSLYL